MAVCSRCGHEGHAAAACPNQPFYKVSTAKGKGKGKARECYECGELGHMRADCPQRLAARTRDRAQERLSEEAQGKVDLVTQLYNGLHRGYHIPESEREAIRGTGGIQSYGEIREAACIELFETLALDRSDVFFDLGSGTGKVLGEVLLLAALCSEVSRAVGLELSETRVSCSRAAIKLAEMEDRCEVYEEDFITTSRLLDATVCYSCNITMPDEGFAAIVARLLTLPRLRLIATMMSPYVGVPQALSTAFQERFRAAGTLNLATTW